MCRVAITFGMIAAVALVSPAGGAISLPHDFFHEPAPSTTLVNFDMIGNLRHDSAPIVDDVLENSASPSFQLSSHQSEFQLGGNGIPLFNVRFDPEHDFYNTLTAQIAVPSVPETSTWMMLLVGFAAIGFAMRRAKHANPKPASARYSPSAPRFS